VERPARTRAPQGPWQALVPPESATFLRETGLISSVAGLSFDLSTVTTLGRTVRIGFEQQRTPIVLASDGRVLRRGAGQVLVATSVERLDRLLGRFYEHQLSRGPLHLLEDELRLIDAAAYNAFWADHCRVHAHRQPGPAGPARLEEARLLVEAGQLWDAVDVYSEILQVDPHLVEAYLGRARVWSQLDEPARADNDVEAARVLSTEAGQTPPPSRSR
jgi:tetratricopeptide (TPR) repeat protein